MLFMELVTMLFMDDELPPMLFGAILFGAMLPVCGAAMEFIELVCIICGVLVVIMESNDGAIMGGLSACMASGSAKARVANDSLSLVVFFMGIYFLLVGWWRKSFCGRRQPAAGGLQRLEVSAGSDPNGKGEASGNSFRMIINDK
jgi:hypothetical protein